MMFCFCINQYSEYMFRVAGVNYGVIRNLNVVSYKYKG
jgi:hypothetical protein